MMDSQGLRIHHHVSLRDRNTFGVDAVAERLIEVLGEDAWPQALALAGSNALVLGGGSNLLLVAKQIPSVIVSASDAISLLQDDGEQLRVRAQAGVEWHHFVMHTLTQGWFGLENLALIPGTVGASPIQNIGAYGVEVMDRIASVRVLDRHDGSVRDWPHDACGFSYRDSRFKHDPQRHVVLSVDFALSRTPNLQLSYAGIGEELASRGIDSPTPMDVADAVITIRQRKLPDPAVIGNAGSFFKNPIVETKFADALLAAHPGMPTFRSGNDATRKLSAAWLIDQCGWKGHRDGDAGVAPQHALVLVNHGDASGAQLLELARRIASSVHARFGVAIEPEPRLIGAQW